MRRFLNAKYKKANLNKVMTEQLQHLNTEKLKRLVVILRKSEDMFDGMLVTWYTTPV